MNSAASGAKAKPSSATAASPPPSRTIRDWPSRRSSGLAIAA